jgi:predicted protein tyrosine phosphatase
MTAQPSGWFAALQARITRRTALAGLGAAGAITAIRGAEPAAHELAAATDVVQPLATLEAFLTTFLGVARERAERLKLSDEQSRLLRAAQCEDEAHYHNLIALDVQATTTRFTLSARHYRDREAFFESFEQVKQLAVGAYMAASRELAAAGALSLVEIVYQIGAVEAQHLALGRLFSGERLPADRAFARWQFHTTAEVLTSLEDAGFINGRGGKFDFPGPVSRNCRGIFGLVAETTEDQPPATPRGLEASPVTHASETPEASTPIPADET